MRKTDQFGAVNSSAVISGATRPEILFRGRAVVVLQASEAQPNRSSSEKVTDDFRCHFLFPSHGSIDACTGENPKGLGHLVMENEWLEVENQVKFPKSQ